MLRNSFEIRLELVGNILQRNSLPLFNDGENSYPPMVSGSFKIALELFGRFHAHYPTTPSRPLQHSNILQNFRMSVSKDVGCLDENVGMCVDEGKGQHAER